MFLFMVLVTNVWTLCLPELFSSDCDKGERSARVAEEVRRQSTGGGGDEVRSLVPTSVCQCCCYMSACHDAWSFQTPPILTI